MEKLLLVIFGSLRILTTLLPQHGYIHPDEFFQFTEPVIGNILNIKHLKTWEFRSAHPIRSMLFPILVSSIFYFLKYSTSLTLTPYIILVIPRFIFTILSFIVDFCIYKICKYSNINYFWPMFLFSSSYITLTYMTHTFTNSLEMIYLSLTLFIVVKSLKEKKQMYTNQLGSILTLGTFNRPTFVSFAFVPLFIWSSLGTRNLIQIFKNAISLTKSILITSLISILIDSFYYDPDTFIFLTEHMDPFFSFASWANFSSKIVIAPLNFFIYNTNTANLSRHGLHPRYFHFALSVPLLFGILGFMAYIDIWKIYFKRYNVTPINSLLLCTFVASIVSLSLIPHQEPRFLIPILPCLTILYGHKFNSARKFLIIWLITNSIEVLIYGYIHQSGITKSIFWLNDEMEKNGLSKHLIFSRMYLPPRHLLNIPEYDQMVNIHDLSIKPFPLAVYDKLESLKNDPLGDIYLIIPSCLSFQLASMITELEAKIYLVKQFTPHFTFEELSSCIWMLFYENDRNWRDIFSLNIYRIYV